METASVAHVCYINSKPFIAIRAISDIVGERSKKDFKKNEYQAAQRAVDILKTYLKHFSGEC